MEEKHIEAAQETEKEEKIGWDFHYSLLSEPPLGQLSG
jgi:hypothetical protein